jgi:hypothetical protein
VTTSLALAFGATVVGLLVCGLNNCATLLVSGRDYRGFDYILFLCWCLDDAWPVFGYGTLIWGILGCYGNRLLCPHH